MKTTHQMGILALLLAFCGCLSASESNAIGSETISKDEKNMSQVIELNGSKVAEITKDGEVWIGGTKAGDITREGEIWVAGTKEGDLTKSGEVWKAGEKVGDITSKGEVWHDGNEIGTVEKDGTIWVGSSREGNFDGGNPMHAAAIVFYGFFELED